MGIRVTRTAGGGGVDVPTVIDATDTEAFLVRKNADGGDIFAVDTTNGVTSFGGVAPVTGTRITLPLENDNATPTLAFGDGDSGFFESADDTLRVATGAGDRAIFDSNGMRGTIANSPQFLNEAASGTNPNLVPSQGDQDTGIGRVSEDNVSLIAGALEAIRAEDPADLAATETSLWLYDLDNGAIQQVTVGVADSGGVGFKLLRIVN